MSQDCLIDPLLRLCNLQFHFPFALSARTSDGTSKSLLVNGVSASPR
jgi:hypothetical protein